MHGAAAETIAATLLALSLAFAVARPLGLAEAFVAVPCAVLAVALGVVPLHSALHQLHQIGPTVGFLAAILVFGHLCAEAGVFDYLGAVAARAAHGSSPRLLVLVTVLAALVTATLTLDATVVLLTPVVLATTARAGVRVRPFAYACARLANSGSLLLPVSNLTNLLAFGASGLSFTRFAALMALPWLIACTLEWVGLRTYFRRDLHGALDDASAVPDAPRFALAVFAATVALFVLASSLDISPAWAALTGCGALLVPRLQQRTLVMRRLVAEASLGFCAFVLALAVIVDGVTRNGLAATLRHLVPGDATFLSLLAIAALAAALANVVNNLPATLALLPLMTGSPSLVLAALIGVNVGPNLAYPGSLATLLWRRQLPDADKPRAAEFHLLGALTVPVLLVTCVAGLWLSLRAF